MIYAKNYVYVMIIFVIKNGDYHSTCCDCLGETGCNNFVSINHAILDKYTRRWGLLHFDRMNNNLDSENIFIVLYMSVD